MTATPHKSLTEVAEQTKSSSEQLLKAAHARDRAAVDVADALLERWDELPTAIAHELHAELVEYRKRVLAHKDASEAFLAAVGRQG